MYGATFEPVCEESEACRSSYDKAPPRDGPGHHPVCRCSGDWNYDVEVVDVDPGSGDVTAVAVVLIQAAILTKSQGQKYNVSSLSR